MVKRLWYVLSAPWSALVLYGGSTRAHGVEGRDLALAGAPWLIGWLLWVSGRYVATGSFRRRETR